MRLVIQRVKHASVTVDGKTVGSIDRGLVALCGINRDDTPADAEWCAKKLLSVRLFDSEDGTKPWVQSVSQAKLGVLLVSQFTLFARLKGNKPDFSQAMGPQYSKPYWEDFVSRVRTLHEGAGPVAEGVFGAKSPPPAHPALPDCPVIAPP